MPIVLLEVARMKMQFRLEGRVMNPKQIVLKYIRSDFVRQAQITI